MVLRLPHVLGARLAAKQEWRAFARQLSDDQLKEALSYLTFIGATKILEGIAFLRDLFILSININQGLQVFVISTLKSTGTNWSSNRGHFVFVK